MRQSFVTGDPSLRDQFLDGVEYPSVRATIRKSRLDFGGALHVKSVALAGDSVGDDYHDQSVGPVIWGSAAVHTESPYQMLQLISPAAWNTGGSEYLYRRLVDLEGTENWNYEQITGPSGVSFKGLTKIGMMPLPETPYVWLVYYVDASDGKMYREKYNSQTGAWSYKSVGGLDLGDCVSAAVYPFFYRDPLEGLLGEDYVVVASYTPPFLKYAIYFYDQVYDRWTGYIYSRTDLQAEMNAVDVQWSGLGIAQGGNDWGWSHDEDNRALVINVGDRAMSIVIDWDSTHGGSDPFEILPSSEWGNMRCRISGCANINGRMWGVAQRWAVGTDDIRYAEHTSLVSSGNGADWRDEGYVIDIPVRGVPLMKPGGDYLYIVGNASVARARACSQIGEDPGDLKRIIYELDNMAVSFAGPGSTHQINLSAVDVDGGDLADFLTPGNEITVEIGANGVYGNYVTGELVDITKAESQEGDRYNLLCLGKLARAIGSMSYRPMGARMYEGPYSLYSTFTLDNGLPRLTLAPQTGEWINYGVAKHGRYSLYCKKPGVAILPHLLSSNSFITRITFKPTVSFEGIYFILWWEDENNYAKIGIKRTYLPWEWGLSITVVQDGVEEIKEGSTIDHLLVDEWYTMTMAVFGNSVKLWFHSGMPGETDPEKEKNGSYSISGLGFTLSEGFPPKSYQIGLEVEDFVLGTWEGSIDYGTVDSSGSSYIQDDSQNFGSDAVGNWLVVSGYERQVVSRTATRLYVTPDFPAPPAPGSAYSVYPRFEDGPMLPGAIFSDFFLYTGEHPWTVGLILGNMLELAGLTPDESVRPVINLVPLAQATDDQYISGHIDAVIEAAGPGFSSNPVIMYLWASSTEIDNQYQFSAYKLVVESAETSLYFVQSLNSGTLPYGYETLIARHPNLVRLSLPGQGLYNTIRVLANTNYIGVYAGAQLLTAFPLDDVIPGGYVSIETALSPGGQAWMMEFREVIDSFIWDSGIPLSGALQRLLQGRRVKFIENENGEIGVSRFTGDWGEIVGGPPVIPVTSKNTGSTIQNRPAVIGVEGAVDRAYILDRELARVGVSSYERVDNPSIIGGPLDVMADAKREMDIRRGQSRPAQYQLYMPDPSLMIENWWTDDEGVRRTINSINMALQGGLDQMTVSFSLSTRGDGETPEPALWDTALFDSGEEYG